MLPAFKANYRLKTKSNSVGRIRQKFIILLFIAAIFVISTTAYNRLMGYMATSNLSLAKNYPDKGACPGIGISNAKLKTKFIGNKVFYIFNVSVAKGKKEKLPRTFTIKLSDKDGFDIQNFTLNASNFTAELDESEKFTGYSYQSAQYMDADKYERVENWNLTWAIK